MVEGGGKRLAVECDGDRWHPHEKLAEDLERQAILERLGWTFVRVRGTEFFRDADRALASVYEMLHRLEIPAEGAGGLPGDPPRVGGERLQRVLRRAEALRREWLDNGSIDDGDEATGEVEGTPTDVALTDLSVDHERVLDALRVAGRPLSKSQILGRARISEAVWSATMAVLRRRGLVIQEGTRGSATYRLAKLE